MASLLDLVPGAVDQVTSPLRRVASYLTPRFRAGNLDDRDPDFMRELLPGLWLLVTAWYRPDISGYENIPAEGPVLVVGNHTGGISSPEVMLSQLALSTYFGVERPHYQLAHRMVLNSPLGGLLRRFGTIEADPGNAEMALSTGAVVTVFPGGDYEVTRPSWQSARIDMGRRKGFLRLALAQGVPIVPMVTLGGQETALFLTRGEAIARALRLDKALRLKIFPLMIGLPFGLQSGLFPHLPLPAKVSIRFLEAVDLEQQYGADPDLDVVYDDLVGRMQMVLSDMQAHRRLPVIG
jgi:1-acyl-sn-glycerol-3-phosphate acyltransferase